MEDIIAAISGEAAYREALARVEALMDLAERGTPEGAELDALVDLIVLYERESRPCSTSGSKSGPFGANPDGKELPGSGN